MRASYALTTFVSLCLASPRAVAQETPDEIARRELIAAAEQARAAGDHARALDLATRAGRLRMTPSLRQMLAYEHDALGHAVEALDAAGRCVREAEVDPALRNRDVILAACRALVDTLRGRVGRVTVRVAEPVPAGLRVTVRGVEVPAPLWGVAYPVEPGEVSVDATAAGGATFHRALAVTAGDEVEVTVAPSLAPRLPPPRRASLAAPVVWWSVGAAGLVAGAVMLGLGAVAQGDRDAECTAEGFGRCDPVALSLDDRYRALTVAGTVTLGVGAASAVAGTLWFLLGRGERLGPQVSLAPSTHGVTLTVGGAL